MPYLSVAKRGYVSQVCHIEVVNAILHKLKSGCQWHHLAFAVVFFKKTHNSQKFK